MPTVLRVGRYRFFFCSNEGREPPHIHVKAAGDEAKYWLDPVRLAANYGSMSENSTRSSGSSKLTAISFWRLGMSTSDESKAALERAYVPTSALAKSLEFDEETMRVTFADGRVLSVPLQWFPALRRASLEQRRRYEIAGGGVSLHWPELDEDLSVAGLLAGADVHSM